MRLFFFVVQRVEDEWKEFEEEERKDYTGLKIGQLQITDDNQTNEEGDGADKYDSDGELVTADGERSRNKPWNKGSEEAAAAAEALATAAATAKAAAAAKAAANQTVAGSSVYISPALRHAPVSLGHLFFFFSILKLIFISLCCSCQ